MSAELPILSPEQVAVVRETFGEVIAYIPDFEISMAVSAETVEHMASGALTAEHVNGAMQHMHEAHDIPFSELRTLATAEALSVAISDVEAGSPLGSVDVTVTRPFNEYAVAADTGAMVEAVEAHMEAVAVKDAVVGATREALGDAVADWSDSDILSRMSPTTLERVMDGELNLAQAEAARDAIAEQLGVDPSRVHVGDAADTLSRALDDQAGETPFNAVHTYVETADRIGNLNESSDLVSADKLVEAVAERTQERPEAAGAEAAPQREEAAEMAF